MKLDSLKKTDVFKRYDEQIPKIKRKDEGLTQITLFMEKKREIERKCRFGDKRRG